MIGGRSLLRAGAVATGADAVAAAVTANVRCHGWLIGHLWRAVRRPVRPADGPAFGVAALWRAWGVYVLLATVTACLAVASVPRALAGDVAALAAAVGCVALAVALAARAGAASVAHWHARGGRGGWRAWWTAGAVVPPDTLGGGRALGSIAVLLLSAVVLVPTVAWAAVTAASGGAETDLALRAIDLLYPTDAPTPLTQMVSALVALAAGGAGLMMCAHTIQAVHEVSDGKSVLTGSGRWFGAPALVRVVVASGLLMSGAVFASGLSGAHVAVAQLARWSSNTASTLWSGFVAQVLDVDATGAVGATGGGGLGIPSPVAGLELAHQILTSDVCHGVLTALIDAAPNWVAPLPPRAAADPDATAQSAYWYWGRCGSLTLPGVPADADAALVTFRRARVQAVGALITAVRATGLADAMVIGSTPGGTQSWPDSAIVAQLRPAAVAYDATVSEAAATYFATAQAAERREIVAASKTQGWTSAGALWQPLGAASGQTGTLASEAPEWTAPDSKYIDNLSVGHDLRDALARLDRQWVEETRTPALAGSTLAALNDDSAGPVTRVINRMTRPIAEWLSSSATGADPLADSVAEGHVLMGAAGAAYVAGGAASVAAKNGLAQMGGLAGAFDWFADGAKDVIKITYVVGAVHAYVLPNIPAISWTYVFLGWLVYLLEALVAIPVLCFLAMRFDGDLMSDVIRPGIILLTNLTVRPIYSVLALTGVYYVLPLGVQMTKFFSVAYIGATGGHALGIGGILGIVLLNLYLTFQVEVRLFSVISEIPDRVLRWWGSKGEDLGEHRGGAVVGAAVGAGQQATRPTGGGGSGGGPGGGGPRLDSKLPDGGSESVGVRPVGGDSGVPGTGGSAGHWSRASGGLGGLDEGQRSAATAAHADWQARTGHTHSLGDYVSHAQRQEAQRGGRG